MNGREVTPLQTFENPERIGEGFHGEVFRISPIHAAKVYWKQWNLDNKLLLKEVEVSRELYGGGVKVPKPEGILPVRVSSRFDSKRFEDRDAFVMEYVEDHDLGNFERIQLITKELRKARALGFDPRDGLDVANSIYNENELYLIDFWDWKMPRSKSQ